MLRLKERFKGLFLKIVLFMILLCQVYPVLWIIISSFKSQTEFRESSPFALPGEINFQNYISVLTNSNILKYFLNSVIVTLISVTLIVLLSCICGFGLQKLRFRINRLILVVFLSGIMIPVQVTLIPLFQIYNRFGWLDSYISVVLPQVGFGLPIAIYLYSTFFEYLPNEILEASFIDGCNIYSSFIKVASPVSFNSAMTVIIVNAIYIWNEFIFANTFLNQDRLKTLPLGLMDFISERGLTDWGLTFASIAISIFPLIVVYFLLNRRIVEGMAAGAVKS